MNSAKNGAHEVLEVDITWLVEPIWRLKSTKEGHKFRQKQI